MLVITGIFENERFIPDKPVDIPQKKKVTVIIEEEKLVELPMPERISAAERLVGLVSKVPINQLMEGSITQSLIGAVPHFDISRDEIRSLRLRKYDGIN